MSDRISDGSGFVDWMLQSKLNAAPSVARPLPVLSEQVTQRRGHIRGVVEGNATTKPGQDEKQGTQRSERTGEHLARAVYSIRDPREHPNAAKRIHDAYLQNYFNDEELFLAICSAGEQSRHQQRRIDGVTEPLSQEHFEKTLSMPDTLALEVPSDDLAAPPLGFLITRLQSDTDDGQQSFLDFIASERLNEQALQFMPGLDRHKQAFLEALRNRQLAYIVEFASRDRFATLGLMYDMHRRVEEVNKVRAHPLDSVFAKCLVAANINLHINGMGNDRVQNFVKLAGLSQVAQLSEARTISVPSEMASAHLSKEEVALLPEQDGKVQIPVTLVFGMFYGKTSKFNRDLRAVKPVQDLDRRSVA